MPTLGFWNSEYGAQPQSFRWIVRVRRFPLLEWSRMSSQSTLLCTRGVLEARQTPVLSLLPILMLP